jgi:hypothetical protein
VAGTVFCQQFSEYQYRALVFVAGMEPRALPEICLLLTRYSPLLLMLPPAVLLVGVTRLLRQSDESSFVELLSQGVLVLSFVLVVLCILVWQVPYTASAGDIL